MANNDTPNGFKAIKTLSGESLSAMIREYTVGDRSADTTGNHGDIYPGDPLKLVSGKVLPANSGDTIVGVASGGFGDGSQHGGDTYVDIDNQSQRNYSPLNETTGIVGVYPAEGILFEVQTAIDLDLVMGSLADITLAAATAHGDRTLIQSNVELTTAVNNDVRVVELSKAVDNNNTLANQRVLVKFQTTLNTL